jgi:uracil-DNA glycosylase
MGQGFLALEREITGCRKCLRLVEWRERVAREKVCRHKGEQYWGRPVPAFGTPDCAMVVIGLAPAAHGGNRTGRMFTGDRSGEWLYEALFSFGFANQPSSIGIDDGLQLQDCLITAVARCAPPDNKPLPSEMENCSEYLFRELQLAGRKRVVVALGQVAFRCFLKIYGRSVELSSHLKPQFGHGREWDLPGNVALIASYHPSQQNTLTGRLTRPMFHSIFRRAREIVNGI